MIQDRIKELRRVKASELLPHPRNWRQHPGAQRAALQGVLGEIGFADAVIVRETPEGLQLIDGHLRQDLMGEQQIPVLVVDLNDEEADKMLVTLDPLAGMADTDEATLQSLLAGLRFQDQAVMDMLASLAPKPIKEPKEDPGPQLDRAEELREKWQTERGQVWEVGRHRLMCGDATSDAHHSILIGMAAIDLVLTDPPYGVSIEYGVGIKVGTTFDDTPEAVHALIPLFMPLCLRWPVVLLTPGQNNLWDYPRPRWVLSWNIPAGGGHNPWGFTTWHSILAYGKDPYLARGLGGRPDGVTMMATRDKSVEGHPVIKPLDVWKWFLERGSPARDERVLDPFLGSGTTMVAAEQLGRICYGMEIEPKYVAVTLERMAGMGLSPRLVAPPQPKARKPRRKASTASKQA